MKKLFRIRFFGSESDHLKSQIQNRQWLGVVAIGVTFALCAVVVDAQQPKKIPRIGYLSAQGAAMESERSDAIRQALRELGYIEGQNIAIEYRYGEGKRDQFPGLAAELVRLKVDIILVAVGATIRAAKNATKTIPIVMAGTGSDPVEQPTKFELVINLKTADQIGVTIPQPMLYRADKVIK